MFGYFIGLKQFTKATEMKRSKDGGYKNNRRYRSSSSSSDESSRPSKRRYKEERGLSKGEPHSSTRNSDVGKSRPTDFSFEKYKYELNKVFCRDSDLIQDVDDFWLFVKKYENIKKRSNNSSSGKSYNLVNYDRPTIFLLGLNLYFS